MLEPETHPLFGQASTGNETNRSRRLTQNPNLQHPEAKTPLGMTRYERRKEGGPLTVRFVARAGPKNNLALENAIRKIANRTTDFVCETAEENGIEFKTAPAVQAKTFQIQHPEGPFRLVQIEFPMFHHQLRRGSEENQDTIKEIMMMNFDDMCEEVRNAIKNHDEEAERQDVIRMARLRPAIFSRLMPAKADASKFSKN
ncbi:hypothetical protein HYV43_01150 [Candidatus Micrarchaeota archaeon]|nr:hypothetical protein [Candidatus Micrarchaeota archaeon]